MADVSFAIVMSAILLHVWKGREIKNSAFSWVDSLGVFLASILCFSLVAGGPLLGSALGESDFAALSHLQWLEEILLTSKLNLSFLPVIPVIPFAIGMLGFFLSVFWLFQSKSRYAKGSEWAQKAIDSLKMHKKEPLLIWIIAFSPFFSSVKKPLRFLEEKFRLQLPRPCKKVQPLCGPHLHSLKQMCLKPGSFGESKVFSQVQAWRQGCFKRVRYSFTWVPPSSSYFCCSAF